MGGQGMGGMQQRQQQSPWGGMQGGMGGSLPPWMQQQMMQQWMPPQQQQQSLMDLGMSGNRFGSYGNPASRLVNGVQTQPGTDYGSWGEGGGINQLMDKVGRMPQSTTYPMSMDRMRQWSDLNQGGYSMPPPGWGRGQEGGQWGNNPNGPPGNMAGVWQPDPLPNQPDAQGFTEIGDTGWSKRSYPGGGG